MRKIISVIVFVLSFILVVGGNSFKVFADEDLKLGAKNYILYNPDSKSVVLSKNENEKTPVASICKLMTSLIVLEEIENKSFDLNDMVIASDYACMVEGSQAFLDAGSSYSVYDLLKSVIVASANDSSIVLAEFVSGSENLFVQKMNNKAKELGMNNTYYENSTGLFTSGQHSTAYDTVKVLEEISKYKLYNDFCNIWMDKLAHPSGRITQLVNTNRLIKYYDYCVNGKTGFVDEAGYCLASTSIKNGVKFIAVVLGCDKPKLRFEDSVRLYNYGFANYVNENVLNTNNPLENKIRVDGCKKKFVEIYPSEDYYAIIKKGGKLEDVLNFELPKKIKAPLKANSIIGKIYVTRNGEIIKEINVVIKEDLKRLNYKDSIQKVISNWLI